MNTSIIAKLLSQQSATLAVAESCTGGYLSHIITAEAGSSKYYKGGVIAYSNEIKKEVLNVRELNLKKHGAVSEFVVNDMAINVMSLFDVDYSVAVSGIAGPEGGTVETPVGTVWIAVATTTRAIAKLFHFSPELSRLEIIQNATQEALQMLEKEIVKDFGEVN